jgi:hypothetical protein
MGSAGSRRAGRPLGRLLNRAKGTHYYEVTLPVGEYDEAPSDVGVPRRARRMS